MRVAQKRTALVFSPLTRTVGVTRDEVAVLREIVAELGQRVEILEAREILTRATFAPRKAGTVVARE